MCTQRHRLVSPLICLGLLLFSTATAQAESSMGLHGGSASASVHIRVVVPPVVRVLQDLHPRLLEVTPEERLRAEQKLVVSTNMRRGFCLDLRNNVSPASHWRLRLVGGDAVEITPQGDGYRLCGSRQGLYTLVLEHDFLPSKPEGIGPGVPWPIRTELTML